MQLTIFFNYCCLEISITVTVFTFIFQLEISVLNTDISPKSVLNLNVSVKWDLWLYEMLLTAIYVIEKRFLPI